MLCAHGQEDTRIFHKECVSLAKAGYEVYEISVGDTYVKSDVNIIGVKSFGSGRINRVFGTATNIYHEALKVDADIYHAHETVLLPFLLKLKRKGKKVIYDSHEFTVGAIKEKAYIPKPIRPVVKFVYELYQNFVCRRIDAVVTATPNITDYFKKAGCKRVIAVCNFPLLKGQFIEPNYHSRAVSFAGGLQAQWNHETVITLLADMNDVKYFLCGRIHDKNYFENLKKITGWVNVDFKGKIPFEEVANLLRSSAVGLALLTPSRNTDWQNGNMANTKIFEEMMAGLPVVCTDFVRWKEFVEGYDCGICVSPYNPDQIKKAIQTLVDNPELARKKGLNGRRAVEEKFNWGSEEKKLLALYKEIEGEIKND